MVSECQSYIHLCDCFEDFLQFCLMLEKIVPAVMCAVVGSCLGGARQEEAMAAESMPPREGGAAPALMRRVKYCACMG